MPREVRGGLNCPRERRVKNSVFNGRERKGRNRGENTGLLLKPRKANLRPRSGRKIRKKPKEGREREEKTM